MALAVSRAQILLSKDFGRTFNMSNDNQETLNTRSNFASRLLHKTINERKKPADLSIAQMAKTINNVNEENEKSESAEISVQIPTQQTSNTSK